MPSARSMRASRNGTQRAACCAATERASPAAGSRATRRRGCPGARGSNWPTSSLWSSTRAMTDLLLDCGGVSDTGLVREKNEDRYWIDRENGIFLVVDGVGG